MSNPNLQDLKSPDPARRRAAIIALADSPDPNAPRVLARVAETDSDPKLRELALKAQQHAEKKRWKAMAAATAAQNPASTTSEAVPPPSDWAMQADRANAALSDGAVLARGQLNNAIGCYNNGDKAGARDALISALQLDPSLGSNPEVQQLAANITGQPYDRAVRALSAGKDGRAQQAGPRKLGDVLISLVAEIILLFLIVAVPFTLMSSALIGFAMNQPQAATPSMAQTLTLLRSVGPLTLGAEAGGMVVFGVLIWIFLMFFGGMLIGGTGTIFEFAEAMLAVEIVGILLNVGVLILFAVLPKSLSTSPNGGTSLFTWVYLLVNLGLGAATVYFAARKHDFDIGRGCITVISPGILMCACLFGLALLSPFSGTPR